jgi:hypothetical protein
VERFLAREWLWLVGSILGGVVLLLAIAAWNDALGIVELDLAFQFWVGVAIYGAACVVRITAWAIRVARR